MLGDYAMAGPVIVALDRGYFRDSGLAAEFVPFRGGPDLLKSVIGGETLVGITGEPLFTRVYRFERANAQHEVGHLTRLEAVERALARHPGLFVTGSGFRGVGIPDCVADGRATAGQIAEWLKKFHVS